MKYKPRKILKIISRFLGTKDILVIHGARQTGKTTLLKILMAQILDKKKIAPENIVYFDLEDFSLLELCNQGAAETVKYIETTRNLKKQKVYFFIDEIQYLSNPSNFLKIFHDHYPRIKLIVSGSSSFDIRKKFKDSLVGRTVDFELFSLGFDEFLNFKGLAYDLSDKKMFKIDIIHQELRTLFEEYLIYGGYPRIVLEKNIKNKEVYLKQILDTYVKKDIRDLAHIRDLTRFNQLLRVLADTSGNQINVLELSGTLGIARQTIEDYLFILEKTYVIKLLRPFFANARTEIAKMPKIFFEDTGMLNLLKYGSFVKKIDGALFETGIYSILHKIFPGERIKYWRTKQKQEIDFIMQLGQRIIPLEVKLTYPQKATNSLKSFLGKYPTRKAFIISLQKSLNHNKAGRIQEIYPWELYSFEKR